MELAVVLVVLVTFAVLAAKLPSVPEAHTGRLPSVSSGVPTTVVDEPTAPRRRLARGSIRPASLDLARVQYGEMEGRRFATPMPVRDDVWELLGKPR